MAETSAAPDQDAILQAWCATLVTRLGLDGIQVNVDAVLGLAGDVAHAVIRPAAPLTAFVVGYAAGLAVGSGTPAGSAASDVATYDSSFAAAATTARDAARDFAADKPNAAS